MARSESLLTVPSFQGHISVTICTFEDTHPCGIEHLNVNLLVSNNIKLYLMKVTSKLTGKIFTNTDKYSIILCEKVVNQSHKPVNFEMIFIPYNLMALIFQIGY